ncbi:helix-turn-helix domain-containing protein [Stenotrophomonas geniculata]|uniref:helix-turn-helix domain-containing protein n=1 Tax=Stenotrophomonas geniculata TaxID=86188 RepID=UPI0039C69AD1
MEDHELQLALGRAMREFRRSLGLSQEGFADSIGMHRAYYSALERGTKNPTVSTLVRVVTGLSISLSSLVVAAERLSGRAGEDKEGSPQH